MLREKIRLTLLICFTGVLVFATIKLTVTALRKIQAKLAMTKQPDWLFIQDSLRRDSFTFDSELAAAKIDSLDLEKDPLVNRILAALLATPPGTFRFKTDTIVHFALPDRQGREADLVMMEVLQEKLRSNRLSGESREAVQKDLAALQAEITGGVGMDRFTREVRY